MADAAINGNWIVQVDDKGDVCSKPPIYTWMGAGLMLLTGSINDFAVFFPSALGVLGCTLLIWRFGGRHFSKSSVFSGTIVFLLSGLSIRMIYLARTDALFAFATFLTACLGFRAWQSGRGWFWFWLAAALATLTKGPLGLILAVGGLVGLFWEERPISRFIKPWLEHISGIIVMLLLTAGWFWVAYQYKGDAVVAKIIHKELLGHADWTSGRHSPGVLFFLMPTFYFITRFFPWSLFAIVGLFKVFKYPAQDRNERAFEIFISSYLCFGILLFSLFPHQRADHLFPLMPAAGLLAGREIIRCFNAYGKKHLIVPLALALWGIFLFTFEIYYFVIDPMQNEAVKKTEKIKALALDLKRESINKDNLFFVDVPFGLQYYMNTMKQRLSFDQAARMLASEEKIYLAVRDVKIFLDNTETRHSFFVHKKWSISNNEQIFILGSSNNLPATSATACYTKER